MSKDNTSPRPWRLATPYDDIRNAKNGHVAIMSNDSTAEDAALIVRAVNAHDDLVAALKTFLQACEDAESTNPGEDDSEFLSGIQAVRHRCEKAIRDALKKAGAL